jgi:hypothetical protein
MIGPRHIPIVNTLLKSQRHQALLHTLMAMVLVSTCHHLLIHELFIDIICTGGAAKIANDASGAIRVPVCSALIIIIP